MTAMTLRRCSRCKTDKPSEAFHVIRGKPHPWCKECRNSYNAALKRERYEKKKDFVDAAEPLVRMCRAFARNPVLIAHCNEWLSNVAAARAVGH